jgi:hypothetical protein
MSDDCIEITESPEVLWDQSVAVTRLTLYGLCIGDSSQQIPPFWITEALPNDVYPPGFVNLKSRRMEDDTYEIFLLRKKWIIGPQPYGSNWLARWKRRLWHKRLNRLRDERGTPWPLEERIPFVLSNTGVVGIQEGHSYGIENGIIATLSINPASLGPLAEFSKRDIVARFGLPDYIWEYCGDDPDLFSTHLLYDRGLSVDYSDDDHTFRYVGIRQDITPWLNPYYVRYTGQPTELFC